MGRGWLPSRGPLATLGQTAVSTGHVCELPRFDGWRCHLYRLAVHPDRRRLGIGSALLAAAEERFVRLGGRRGDAMVLKRNETAHHAWRAAGYTPEEHWRRWVKPLGE
ncbi:GNAT family N-acetyltransferase [Streptomyces yerevanensis]|uniref:GNAT family N-acetyltransferase n=1 Tax=Streptomyces yerevanensis TaxID=66378 RepID=UPI00247FFEB6|nr:GNAT family N-acetyltransferase [Streptomyces yerevanensis]